MGHWGVWGYVLARVRVIEEGGVIGMGYSSFVPFLNIKERSAVS